MFSLPDLHVRRGELVEDGVKALGMEGGFLWFRCLDCGTTFPMIGGLIMCNGHSIAVCPWCRPDTKPWIAGRGV